MNDKNNANNIDDFDFDESVIDDFDFDESDIDDSDFDESDIDNSDFDESDIDDSDIDDSDIDNFYIEDFVTDNLSLCHLVDDLMADRVLIRYRGKDAEVKIPQDVTMVGSFAFCANFDIKKLVIPATVTHILPHAFENCYNLEEVVIEGSGLLNISDCAFSGCLNLIKINIPNSVTAIGDCAFTGCLNLPKIYLPDSLIRIYEGAFAGCAQLYVEHFPKSISTISAYSFSQVVCVFDIPDTVTTIEDEAFAYTMDVEIFIPKSIKKIGANAFFDQVQIVRYEGTEAEWQAIEIDEKHEWLDDAEIKFNSTRKSR